MNISSLRTASQIANQYGVKSVIFGQPGTGKTPLIQTAPRPVLCAIEPGLLSMRGSNVPVWEAKTTEKINEFFTWVFQSNEAKKFDTIGIDSISQLSELILTEELKRNKDGRKAYGELSRRVMDLVDALYLLPQKNIYIIAKEAYREVSGTNTKVPYFPGQDLNIKIPHLFDEILHIGQYDIPNVTGPQLAIRTKATYGVLARDRSGKLAELEPPNIGELFKKCMS